MKLEITEFRYGFNIEIIAETIKEAGILLRISNQQKREVIEMDTWFTSEEIKLNYFINKVFTSHNYINSKTKIKT
jgi:hypothetical protein